MPDPRGHSNALRHSLHDILVIGLCATLCGAETFVEMEGFGNSKLDWLRERLGLELPSGIPSHDTFGRIFSRLNPEAFATCFRAWTQEIQRQCKGQVIAVDGKTLRRSFNKATGRAAVHMVSAWSSRNRLVLGQLAIDSKSNEITAVPALLKMLDLAGCIVTVDALNCQKSVAEQVLAQKGDYLFALKRNHPQLHEDAAAYFSWALGRVAKGADRSSLFTSYADSHEYGHGRREVRRCWCVEAMAEEWPEAVRQWPGLRSIIMVESERSFSQITEKGHSTWGPPSREQRYYLSSLAADAASILDAVRDHWGIENSVHWVLDVAFREDECRIRKDNAAINMAMLRHLGLNLLRQDTSNKHGIKAKRMRAGWDNEYLLRILAAPES
jgi:predicted transposase YbfD/YdcC